MVKFIVSLRGGAYKAKRPVKMWIDVGSTESDFMGMAAAAISILTKNGYEDYDELAVYEAPGGVHSERSWAERVEPVLLYFFGTSANRNPSRSIWKKSSVSVK